MIWRKESVIAFLEKVMNYGIKIENRWRKADKNSICMTSFEGIKE